MDGLAGGWIIVFITVSNTEEGIRIARTIVGEKLAACVNIVDNVRSIYWWEGRVEESDEAILIVKTRVELFNKLVERVRELHSYSVPEIIALPILTGYREYMDWLDSSVSK